MFDVLDLTAEALPITVVIVNANAHERARLVALATRAGHKVIEAATGSEILAMLTPSPSTVVVVDRNAGDMTASQMLLQLRLKGMEIPTVVTVPPLAILEAVDAIRTGARDVLEYPLGEQRFLHSIAEAVKSQ